MMAIAEDQTSPPAASRVNTVVLISTLVSGLFVFICILSQLVVVKRVGLRDVCISLTMVHQPPQLP